MPEVRISLIVHMKLTTNGVKANWYVVIGLCPLNSWGVFLFLFTII